MLSFPRPDRGADRISTQDAVARAGNGTLVLIDVREAGEVAASGKAQGALHIPLALVRLRCDPNAPDCPDLLSRDGAVALYCASGGRSQMAAQMLRDLGYAEVYNIGGLGDWIAAGGKLER
ncbi:rhodanese-like domain-containing protein [Defluviimonas sp. WL0002]|uniref:Rhodanese-like domain-containing protein n=1 Tax=Albidovulum marisflavi TaxID=2984159 RepID=A0ABT2ZH54_9RHOB|nr:rhodanese-like domain-containing protein [Defluviimonas sp. WL0002]MCV2870464.1 rhodanese-like domain-containing protein [Defluviimonas sp. WL0002]